jgi:hypothetical protein
MERIFLHAAVRLKSGCFLCFEIPSVYFPLEVGGNYADANDVQNHSASLYRLGRNTFSPDSGTPSLLAFSKRSAGRNKLPKRILKVGLRFRFGVPLRIDPGNLLNPGNVARADFFIDSR